MGSSMGGGGQSGGFSSSSRSQFGSRNAPKSIRAINSQVYKKEISDKGMTWLLLSYTASLKGTQQFESLIEDVANSLQGALKVWHMAYPFRVSCYYAIYLLIVVLILDSCSAFYISGWKH